MRMTNDYYDVKAVPKALVSTSERSIKKINGEPVKEEKKTAEKIVNTSAPLFTGQEPEKKKTVSRPKAAPASDAPVLRKPDLDDIDFEKTRRITERSLEEELSN